MNKLLITTMLLSMVVLNAYGQTQLTKWSVYGQNITFSTNPSIAPTVSSNGLPTTFKAKNSMYTNDGKLLFYVGDWKIYDRFGNSITDLQHIPSPYATSIHGSDFNGEFPIVPCIETSNSCVKHYYVFYSAFEKFQVDGNMKLFAKIVTVNNQTGEITAEDVIDGTGNRRVLATSITASVYGTSEYNYAFGAQAVSKLVDQKRFLYWIAGNVTKITLTDLNSANNGISSPSVIFNSSNNSIFEFGTLEADLSHDGTKLLWGTIGKNLTTQNYFMIGLTRNGNWDNSTMPRFSITTSSNNSSVLRGVEFAPDGNSIYVTTGGTIGNHGIYWKSLTPLNSAFQYITGSVEYGKSQLECAKNGLLYATSFYKIASINMATKLFFPTGDILVNTSTAYGGYYALPDQIDGENYDLYLANYDYDIRDMVVPPATNISTGDEWTQISNPINNSGNPIKIGGTLAFTNPGLYYINEMQFEFGENAKILVGTGATVSIYNNSKFKASPCAKFWKGIELIGTGALRLFDCEMYDANIAVYFKGEGSLAVYESKFDKNETHIRFDDYQNRFQGQFDTTIGGNQFLHTAPLKRYNGAYFGGPSIILITTRAAGADLLILDGNYFEGTIAIRSTRAPFTLVKTNRYGPNILKNMTSYTAAISIDMQNTRYSADISHTVFDNVIRAVSAINQTNLRFEHNTINNTKGHAVELYKNNNCNLSLKNNTFTRFYKGAILLNSNAGSNTNSQTKVNISENTFDNTAIANTLAPSSKHVPTAITIDETGQVPKQHFTELRVTNNTITNAAYGIKTSNVKGYQEMDNPYDRFYNTDRKNISDIDNNTIKVFATYTVPQKESDINSGVQLNNSIGLRVAVNTISTNKPTIWRNRGIHTYNTQQTLIHKNNISATGRGIAGEYSGMGNDMNCNTFTNVVNGISLKDFSMRSKGVTHGIKSKESRDNGYSSTAAEDIELYLHHTGNSNNPQNVQQLVERNQWLMVQNPDVLIDPSPGPLTFLSYIKPAVFAPNLCNDPVIISPGDGDPIVAPIPAFTDNKMDYWQQKYNYARQQKDSGLVVNPFINALMDVEQLTTTGKDSAALVVLKTMTASEDVYEQNYITVYTILLTARLQGERELDSLEKAKLIAIAAQNTYTAGPANYTARVILWQYEGLNFVDMEDRALGLRLKLEKTPCADVLPNDFTIRLKANNNYIYTTAEVPIQLTADGYIYIAANILATLPTNMQYSFVYTGGAYVAQPFRTISDWMQTSNLSLCQAVLNKRGNEEHKTDDLIVENTQVEALAIVIYPNPANEKVTIQLPAGNGYELTLNDVMGKTIYTGTHHDTVLLPVNHYLSGVYMLTITNTLTGIAFKKQLVITK